MTAFRKNTRAAGFSLIELAAAIFVLGIGLPAVAYLYYAAILTETDSSSRARAQYLANGMLNEISQRRFYEDAANAGNSIDDGETNAFVRSAFDDIDDYNIFKMTWGHLTPPRDETGTVIPDYTAYSQYAEISNIPIPNAQGALSLSPVADGSTEMKLVTVIVRWDSGRQQVVVSKIFSLP